MKSEIFKERIAQSLVLCFGLWDLYSYEFGLRPLDIIGFVLTLSILYNKIIRHRFSVDKREVAVLSALVAWVVIYGFYGLSNYESSVKPVLGFSSGLILFLCLYFISAPQDIWIKLIDWFLFANITLILSQTFFYYTVGIIMHPFSLLGLEPRSLGAIYRPTGFSLEPASYCFTTLMFLSIRRQTGVSSDKLFWCAIFSILVSISFWGAIASVLFVIIKKIKRQGWFGALGFLLLFFIFFRWSNGSLPDEVVTWISERTDNLGNDNSAHDRYAIILSQDSHFEFMDILFGYGLSNNYLNYGSNGLGYMLNAGGIFGGGVFFLLILSLRRVRVNLSKILTFILFLSAAPIWNTFVWWFWMAVFLTGDDSIPNSEANKLAVMV